MYKFNIDIDDENIKEGDVSILFETKNDEVKNIEIKASEKWDVLASIMYLIRTCCYDNLEFSKEQLIYSLNTALEEDYEDDEDNEKDDTVFEGTIELEKEEAEQFKNIIEKVIKRRKENK